MYNNNRQAKVNRKAVPLPDESKKFVGFADSAWPVIGADLNHIIREGKLPVPLRLSFKQIEKLGQEVQTPMGKFPCPNDERLAYPEAWHNFIVNFYKMPVWNYKPHSMASIIDMICGYHYTNGWLIYRPALEVKAVKIDATQHEAEVNTWLKR